MRFKNLYIFLKVLSKCSREMPFQRSKIQNISGVQYHRTPLKMSSLLPKVTKLLDPPLRTVLKVSEILLGASGADLRQ